MPDFNKKENLSLFIAALALAGVAGFGVYQYQTNQALSAQVRALTQALEAEGVVVSAQDDALVAAVERVAPAVVSIVVSKEVPQLQVEYENLFGNDPRFRDFNIRIPVYRQIGTTKEQVGAGTGFIVTGDGHIVTNRHVVDDEEAMYTALLADGSQREARVVYLDPTTDLAIIKIEGDGYPTVPLGDSSSLALGQTVAAIGNALGEYSNSVSVGIVSGLNRTVEARDAMGTSEELSGVIQTDAAINLGNSGGPLFNLSGEVVGVNVVTALGAQSIAFAIPINDVKEIIDRVL